MSNPAPFGGQIAVNSQVPAVTTSAYSAGQAMGGLLQWTGLTRGSGKSGILQMVVITCKTVQTTPLDLLFFHTNPSSTTVTDHGTFSLNAADYDKISGVVHITDWTSLGTSCIGQSLNLALPFRTDPTVVDLYGVLIARGALTLGSTTDLRVTVKVVQA